MGDTDLLPFRTKRLLIRGLAAADVDALVGYRNDPDVARYQQWPLPYDAEMARKLIVDPVAVGPMPGEWVQLAIDDGTGTLVGDLGLFVDADAPHATVGYTLASHHQGNGFAVEAVGALVDRLFARGIHRVEATLDPDNTASARVVERLGFRYEGCSRQASQTRGEWGDDDRYAILAADRADWRRRPTGEPVEVRLVEITDGNMHAVAELATHHSQDRFVAPVAYSYGDALFPGEEDGEPVAFVMLALPHHTNPEPYLWRMLVDACHQGRGIGRRALGLVARHFAAEGASTMGVSWVDERGGPAPFYAKLGFEPTGDIEEGEIVARVAIDVLLASTSTS